MFLLMEWSKGQKIVQINLCKDTVTHLDTQLYLHLQSAMESVNTSLFMCQFHDKQVGLNLPIIWLPAVYPSLCDLTTTEEKGWSTKKYVKIPV